MKKSDLKKVVDAMKPAFKANDIAEFGKVLVLFKRQGICVQRSNVNCAQLQI